ncbi:MAG: glycosyltransferase, partial [Alphaproteobacteria bacterium]|nr:glycosyltransferase [Alphaproteobacteria bacterium]
MFFILGFTVVAAWVYLAVAHGMFWLPLWPSSAPSKEPLPSVDIVVPARNEAHLISTTLPSLLGQKYAGTWKVILVDDHSQDGTADIARKVATEMKREDRLTILQAPDLPAGWSGKVAAMNAGVSASSADFILFTDADIRHPLASLDKLVGRAQAQKLDLVSRMVKLHCESIAEKLLIPAFIFFFMMLYPFRQANSPYAPTAAAAGGVMLVRRTILDKIGGLAAIKSSLIDDCALAREIKKADGATELTLSEDIDSVREHTEFKDIWQMIARTAYTQLKYSPFNLAKTIIGLIFLFLLPVLLFMFAPTPFAI